MHQDYKKWVENEASKLQVDGFSPMMILSGFTALILGGKKSAGYSAITSCNILQQFEIMIFVGVLAESNFSFVRHYYRLQLC
jgi:hypothetical protein